MTLQEQINAILTAPIPFFVIVVVLRQLLR